jgi:hypothetical protein
MTEIAQLSGPRKRIVSTMLLMGREVTAADWYRSSAKKYPIFPLSPCVELN